LVPRHKIPVKIKSLGAIDIHFHGAFGIDVMTASSDELDELARLLGAHGVSAFCPTTLSVPLPELKKAVRRIGNWIELRRLHPLAKSSQPLGIHLEGPYLHPDACGAHPSRFLRRFDFKELETLWQDSCQTLKIVTLAPERLKPGQLKKLAPWAKKNRVTLSLGHSQATEEQAHRAFDSGFSSLTHGWNALAFHQRSPGAMGAALGRPGVSIELILDQVHVAPTVMRWTRRLHGPATCYVSDCVPATGMRGWHSFGNLKIRFKEGACRLKNGKLAGGGRLLPEAFGIWIESEELPHLGLAPLRSLGLETKKLGLRNFEWKIGATGRIQCAPLD
jgi:N-acetylgalactosamine-6-phosphate deacetylase